MEMCLVLVIRHEQMTVLRRCALEGFRATLARNLRVAFREQTERWTDSEIDTLIWTGVDKANGYGVTRPADVARFIEYLVCLGPDFDTDQATRWARDILRSTRLDGTTKMALIDRGDRAHGSPTRAEIIARNMRSTRLP